MTQQISIGLRHEKPVWSLINSVLHFASAVSVGTCFGTVCSASTTDKIEGIWAKKLLYTSAVAVGSVGVNLCRAAWRWKTSKWNAFKKANIRAVRINTQCDKGIVVKTTRLKKQDSCKWRVIDLALNIVTISCSVLIFVEAYSKYYSLDKNDPKNNALIDISAKIYNYSVGLFISVTVKVFYDPIHHYYLRVKDYQFLEQPHTPSPAQKDVRRISAPVPIPSGDSLQSPLLVTKEPSLSILSTSAEEGDTGRKQLDTPQPTPRHSKKKSHDFKPAVVSAIRHQREQSSDAIPPPETPIPPAGVYKVLEDEREEELPTDT